MRTRDTFKHLARVWPYARRYRFRLGIGIACFGIARLLEAMVPLSLAVSINRIAEGNWDVFDPVFWIVGAVIGRYAFVTSARYLVRSASLKVAYDLRRNLYETLQSQGAVFFNEFSVGDMMTRAVADISLIQRLISLGTILAVILVYATIVGFAFMLYLSPMLTLLLIPPLPLVFFYARWSARQMGQASQDVQERLSDLSAQVQENLSGIRTIQAMVQEDNEIKRFARTNQLYADAFYRQAWVTSMMGAWMPSLAAICTITVLGVGGTLVLDGELAVGDFVAFFMYISMVVQPFRVAGFMLNMFQRAAVASQRVFDVMDRSPEIPNTPSGETPDHLAGKIELKNLSFTFPGANRPAIDGIDLAIAAGETVAIMGPVGAGKTTILRQIVRLLEPPPVSVFIDGHPVADYPLDVLRRDLAYVPQDAFLFAEPLRDNLTYDDPERALARIWAAATSADLRATIEGFPEQMDTEVGERGVTLSGGQKQRAALARGLIRNAPVLLLDDCFSAVDTETEEHILSELRRLRVNQTTLLVSHRVSTARHADRIVVLERGRITEIGSHDDLIKSGGYYAELERIQREGASSADLELLGTPIG